MAEATIIQRRRLLTWTTRDILMTAVLGLICGLLIVPLVYAYAVLLSFGPLVLWSITGACFFPAFLIAYCVRRPGAVLVGMLLVGLVQLPFTPAGAAFLMSALL
jgi:energy-coupling factor transport system substrate-specific component